MNFKYRAKASDGEIVEGYVDADDQKRALEALRGRGSLHSGSGSGSGKSGGKKSWRDIMNIDLGALLTGGRVPLKNLMIFFRQLATMENAGLSLSTALNVIAESEKNHSLKTSLYDIRSRIDRGIPLSQAMSQQKAFNALLVSLIEAGEEGGMLGQALEQSAVLLEKQEQLRSKIRSALFYPGFVMFFAVVIVIFFFMFLVPKFEEVFATLSIELPQITLTLFAMGNWFSRNWYIIALIVLGIIFGIHLLNKNKHTRGTMDRIKLKIPVMKDLLMKASMARSSRTLSALTAAGVPIVRGIEMAEETAGNEAVKDGYKELRTSVVRGVLC